MPEAKRSPPSPPSGPRPAWLALENLPYLILGVLGTASLLSRLYLALR